MMKLSGLVVVVSVCAALGQDFPWPDLPFDTDEPKFELPTEQPKFVLPTEPSKPRVVEEDNVIINLMHKKEYRMNCPSKSTEYFAQWFKKKNNGQTEEVEEVDGKFEIIGFKDSILKSITTEDEATYFCVDIAERSVVLKRFRIVIIDPRETETTEAPFIYQLPIWSVTPPKSKRIDNTRRAIIPCRADGVDVEVNVYRLKDDGSIQSRVGRKGLGGLVFLRPKLKDSGKYRCVASNVAGKIEYDFEVTVIVHGKYGEWSEWAPCDKPCGFGMTTRTKECDSPAPANGGRYCSDRESGIETKQCYNMPCSRPRLTKFGFEITDKELIMSCNATGIPPPKFQWKIGGRIPTPFKHRSPEMRIPIKMARAGSYSCTVSNSVGYYFTMYITIRL